MKRPPPDTRPSWKDPDLPVIRKYRLANGQTMTDVDPDYERRRYIPSGHVAEFCGRESSAPTSAGMDRAHKEAGACFIELLNVLMIGRSCIKMPITHRHG